MENKPTINFVFDSIQAFFTKKLVQKHSKQRHFLSK